MRVFIIAEAGVNHNGDMELAGRLVDAAADAGADAVKFQTFRADALVSPNAPKAAYQKATTGGETQLEMLRRLELDEAAHRRLMDRCRKRGIRFLSTPFDLESVDLLTERLGLALLKIPSGELTNGPLLVHAARTGRNIILSTGMSTLDEVRDALGALAFGYVQPDSAPGRQAFARAFSSDAGQRALQEKVTVLHCTTEYPAPVAEANLRAMDTLREVFGLPVGLSDHTPGNAVAIAATARGAAVIEKHFTLDRALPGPDHQASLEPGELQDMVAGIRAVTMALGDGDKQPTPSEQRNAPIARRSLVAAKSIRTGETFRTDNVTAKRPGTGLTPMAYWDLLGREATRDYAPDDLIEP